MIGSSIWDRVLSRIETKVNRHIFYTWFKQTSFLADDGATIAVRYDPQNLQRAVLEIGQLGAARYLFAGTLFAGVGVGALAFAIWSATLPVR